MKHHSVCLSSSAITSILENTAATRGEVEADISFAGNNHVSLTYGTRVRAMYPS